MSAADQRFVMVDFYNKNNKNKNSLLSKYIEIHWKLLFSAH